MNQICAKVEIKCSSSFKIGMTEEQRKAIYDALHDPQDERYPGQTWWRESLGSPSPLSYEESMLMSNEDRIKFWMDRM